MIRKRKHIESHWMQLNISLNEQMNNHKQAHKCTLCIVICLFTKYILKKKLYRNNTRTKKESLEGRMHTKPMKMIFKLICLSKVVIKENMGSVLPNVRLGMNFPNRSLFVHE